jgi:hypothetical protein
MVSSYLESKKKGAGTVAKGDKKSLDVVFQWRRPFRTYRTVRIL